MSAQYTPGPWEVAGHYIRTRFDGKSGGWAVAAVDTVTDEHEANARLIAAAPDLLAVVQELEESASYWSEYDVPLGIVGRIRAAIAKATGEQA